jgi:hypothetical protein
VAFFSAHNSFEDEMSARQILPQAASAQQQAKQSKQTGELAAAQTASSSTLGMLFRRLAHIRRRRAAQPVVQIQQRNSWPTTGRRRESASLARRAQQSLVAAWASLQRDSSATKSKALAPPQFLLRTQRRLSQRFNLKIVQAVGKDVRRIESRRRNSLTLLEVPGGKSRSSSDITDDLDHEYPLRLSERLSLSLGRKLSRDFAPMLTEGTALECRVRELVYGLLRDGETFEGHICSAFFSKQEAFTSSSPAACRYYLGCVRDTISDLVQFIREYRLRDLAHEFRPILDPRDNQVEQDADAAFTQQSEPAVQRAVEEYFCFSLRYEIRQWCAGVVTETVSDYRASRFRKTLARWGELPPTNRAFGLRNPDPQLATQLQVATAIAKLQALETCATPSRKMDLLLGACHAISEFIARQSQHSASLTDGDGLPLLPPLSPTSRVCLGDADAFLPLLIFAVSRSHLRDAFTQCALLHGLYPFASQHGECMYYLTMFEAALEFIRTHSQ